jgi:hypothetical protein
MRTREPALWIASASALLALLVGYGILDLERADLWKGLLVAVVPLLQGWLTRSQVMPVEKLRDAGLSPELVDQVSNSPNHTFDVVKSFGPRG